MKHGRIERGLHPARGREPEQEADDSKNGETLIDGVRVNADGEVIADTDEQGGDHVQEEDDGDAAQRVSDVSPAT